MTHHHSHSSQPQRKNLESPQNQSPCRHSPHDYEPHNPQEHDQQLHDHQLHQHSHVTFHATADATSRQALTRLGLVFTLSAVVMLAEFVGSLLSSSLTLLADAGHMLVDSAGLLIALSAALIMRRPRSDRHTWGLARVEVLSAAMQAGMLLTVCIAVTIEAIHRFIDPTQIHAGNMAIFAFVGLLANLIGLMLLHGHSQHSLNTRAAFLEVLGDTFGSVAVLTAAGVTAWTGWEYADPTASLIVTALMGPRAVSMLIRCTQILLESTPKNLNLAQVREHILAKPNVIDVHDLHVSRISSSNVALTAHVTIAPECFHNGSAPDILHAIQHCVSEHFPIPVSHCTIQLDIPQHRDHEHLNH